MNNEITVTKDGSISIPVWAKKGNMLVRRECLDADDPDQTYNFLKAQGYVPEHYGVFHPQLGEKQEMLTWGKERLIAEIFNLRNEILAYEKAGF